MKKIYSGRVGASTCCPLGDPLRLGAYHHIKIRLTASFEVVAPAVSSHDEFEGCSGKKSLIVLGFNLAAILGSWLTKNSVVLVAGWVATRAQISRLLRSARKMSKGNSPGFSPPGTPAHAHSNYPTSCTICARWNSSRKTDHEKYLTY